MCALKFSEDIKNWSGKPKELIATLSDKVVLEPKLFSEVIELLGSGSKVERGYAADITEQLSKSNPEIIAPYIGTLISHINDKVPKVKWGTQEAIGNLSAKYPKETEQAIPKILLNTKDDSTVVKWCAAYALSEIAKNNPAARAMLVPKMREIVLTEKNNGVKNVYLKAIKKIGKN
jgi:hypothetical protein